MKANGLSEEARSVLWSGNRSRGLNREVEIIREWEWK